MRTVVQTEDGVLEINYTWLPTWIGLQASLLKEAGEHLKHKSVGKELNDSTLDMLHEAFIDFTCEKYPLVAGLRDYLSGLTKVGILEDGEQKG